MMTTHSNLESQESKSQVKDRKNKLIVGSIVATLIAITPYIFYLYESVPDEKILEHFFIYL